MKHGVAFRKFSRDTSHRMLMLRNLVTSLIEHEQIQTTLPKARDAARLAEKIITLGKQGDVPAARKAQGFLLKEALITKLFGPLARRYAQRPGGYTRIHKFGNRQGDNAPMAVLELVDNPRDLRFAMTARAIGWELFGNALSRGPEYVLGNGVQQVEEAIRYESNTHKPGYLRQGLGGRLRRVTQDNLKKVLKYRPMTAVQDLTSKAEDHIRHLVAQPLTHPKVHAVFSRTTKGDADSDKQELAAAYELGQQKFLSPGSRTPTMDRSTSSMAYGILRKRRSPGLGLPGAGWYDRQRAKLREREKART